MASVADLMVGFWQGIAIAGGSPTRNGHQYHARGRLIPPSPYHSALSIDALIGSFTLDSRAGVEGGTEDVWMERSNGRGEG